MIPIKLNPAYKDYLWGGNRLVTEYGKKSGLAVTAESWELSTHPDGESVIENGEFAGKTLTSYIRQFGKQALGTKCVSDTLPILIKLIDAKQQLSIQVHPDDAYAKKYENDSGKTELWVVLDCEPGAFLYCGFQKPITKEAFRRSIEDKTLTGLLHKITVKPGDAFLIEAGTLHAIGAGIVIAEIQQCSNVTYRVYDFDRVDAAGNRRALHVDKAAEVTDFTAAAGACPDQYESRSGYRIAQLAACPYFSVFSLKVDTSATMNADPSSFHSLLCTKGEATLLFGNGEAMACRKGDCFLIPAGSGEYKISGDCEILLSTL